MNRLSLKITSYAAAKVWRTPGWLLLCLAVLFTPPVLADQSAMQSDIPGPAQLNAMSKQLIDKVKTGKAKATEFRTNVVFYRESLRSLMLANEKATTHKIASDLLMKMVRMSALLQSAAECQTGRYISCPANLIHELDQQQQQLKLSVSSTKTAP